MSVPTARGSQVIGAPAGLNTWHGLDHFDQRTANAGNQFSLEPPDQGLCVGGGQVLEIVNNVVQSYAPAGTPTSPVLANSQFFGYPPAIIRAPLFIGPQITDPSCIFDARAQKFFTIALTYEVVPTGDDAGQPTGVNRIDIAVSTAAAPTVAVQRYSIPVQNDGTEGTPSHPNCPCVGDFPHIGMDAFGVYITTNEYPWFEDGFNGAQLYAISRKQLEAGAATLKVIHFDELEAGGGPAFTMFPANSNEGDYNTASFGTENFLSSMAAPEAGNENGIDNRIAVWELRNTRALDTPFAAFLLRLDNDVVRTQTYAIPPPSDQKASEALPLRDCLNDRPPPAGAPPPFDQFPCSLVLNNEVNTFKPEVEGPLDSSDSRVLTHWFVNGTLIGALDTALKVNGQTKAGIAWFAFDAGSSRLVDQDYVAVASNNVIYPAVATLKNGKGAMAFTLSGRNYFPSAAYSLVAVGSGRGGDDHKGADNADRGHGGGTNVAVGNPTIAFAGVGPQDGFSEYKYYSPTGDGVPRPRWGDYGAARTDGTSVWIASEYIGQTCTYDVWLTTGLNCGATRTALANWGTRVTQVNP